ncbi:MAG: hypothetical protein ACYDA6_10065 [Solirubrobacteraceae bacterium]
MAVIVVLCVVPSTRAVLPFLTTPAHAECVPLSYFVDDVSSTVTVCPVDVNSSKPEVDTLPTLPIDPPAAGPDRAFGDPLLPGTGCPGVAEVDDAVAVVLEPVLPVALTMP